MLIFLFTRSPVYEATAKVAFQGTPEVMDFGADFMPSVPGTIRSPSPLARAIGIVMSDHVLGRVVDRMPEPSEESPKTWFDSIRDGIGTRGEEREIPREVRRHQRIAGLRQTVELVESGGSTILEISARAPDGASAAWTANAVAESLVTYESDQRRKASRAAIAWLSQKANELRQRIRLTEEALAGLVADLGPGPRDIDLERESRRSELFGELRAAKLELLIIEGQLAELAPYRRVAASEELLAIQERYRSAKLELETARLRYTDTHPEVQRLRQIVVDHAARLGPALRQTDEPFTPERLQEARTLEAERSQLRARVNVLEGALEELVDSELENAASVAEYERMERESALDREMLQVILQRTNETVVSAASESPSARILDYAVLALHPVYPNPRRILVLGVSLALAFAFGVGSVREFLDQRVYRAETVAAALDLLHLGSVPVVRDGSAPEQQTHLGSMSPLLDSYRNIRTAILHSSRESMPRTLVVTSATVGEGKTTTAINLAGALAQTDRKILLLDADLRRPRVHDVLGFSREPGLTELLRGEVKEAGAIRRAKMLNCDVITSGGPATNPAELLGSPQFEQTLLHLAGTYDLIVVDAPILLAISDALILACRADAVVLVHRLGSVEKQALARLSSDLKRGGANALGFVLNQVDTKNPYQYPPYLNSPYLHEPPQKTGLEHRRGAASRGS